MSAENKLNADGRFVVGIPGTVRDKLVGLPVAEERPDAEEHVTELARVLASMTSSRVGKSGRRYYATLSRPATIVLAEILETVGEVYGRRIRGENNAGALKLSRAMLKLAAEVRKLLADHVPVRIQVAGVPDGMAEDGKLMYKRPYPFVATGQRGQLLNADSFAGKVARIVGFQNDLAKAELNVLWREVLVDPSLAIGKYVITADPEGHWSTWQTAVELAEKLEPQP